MKISEQNCHEQYAYYKTLFNTLCYNIAIVRAVILSSVILQINRSPNVHTAQSRTAGPACHTF